MKQNFVRLRTTPTEKAYQLGTPFCVWSFPLRRAFSGHTILCAPHSPFLHKQKFLQIRVRGAKASFCLREKFGLRNSRRAVACEMPRFKGKPERFSPHATSQQGNGGQAVRAACRHALVHLLLLFPQNLTPLRALRFSGAPVIF